MPRKKYILTNQTISHKGITLYKIRACIDIFLHNVKAGQCGGYIQSYRNLSQHGSCWVGDQAKVYESARVENSAIVCAEAELFHSAKARGKSRVYGDAVMYGRACVEDTSEAYENTEIHESAHIKGHSLIHGSAILCGNCEVVNSNIRDLSEVYTNAEVIDSDISGSSTICGKAYAYKETCMNEIRY